ncbi:MAG: hypothetical protein AAGD28_22325 [Bacteroidota bacterium]
MTIRSFIIVALLSFSSTSLLRSQTVIEKEALGFGLDVYGIFLPIFFYDFHTFDHLHAAITLPEMGGFGLAYSRWGAQGYYRNEYSGMGVHYRRDFKRSFIKFETGLMLKFRKPRDFYNIGLRPGSRIPYVRGHMGWPLGPRFYTGFVINWVPKSKHIIYTDNFSGTTLRDFNSWGSSPNQHKSLVFFVGLCLK